jgi:hypothetical protein
MTNNRILTTIYNEFGNKTPVFISGRRTNVDFLSMKEAISYGNIRNAVKTRGILFGTDAEDYFITNKLFENMLFKIGDPPAA